MSQISFQNQVVIVTGAGGALGRTYALDIARRGGAVVVNDLGGTVEGHDSSRDTADRVVAEIRAAGGRAIASYDSVETTDGAQRIVATTLGAFGRVDALINNAGNFRSCPFDEARGEDLDALLSAHLVGTFNATHAVWAHMKAQRYGRIVFTTSAAGMLGHANLSAYGSAKGGITGLMNVLSQEGAPHGILCNALMPNAMSRMGQSFAKSGVAKEPKDNPHLAAILPTMDPVYNAGITVYLASDACTSTHSIYSSLGGRVARVFVGVTQGWQGPREVPASAEDIAMNIEQIRDVAHGFDIPDNLSDEYRIVATGIAKRSR
ncbi:MAG: SDR family NAD(P)-dependent oxidoreductase [Sinimarinibacterium sp.]|jgi:NAD(P)-dependent dehydrogenase (short-subunit alcohol dehydrogenase family)